MSTEHPHSHLSAVVYSSSSDDAGGRQSESSAQWHEWQQAFCQDAGMRTVCAAAVLLFSVSTLFFQLSTGGTDDASVFGFSANPHENL